MSNDNIPTPRDSVSGLKKGRDILKNGSQKHYQCHVTLSSSLGGDSQEKTKALGSKEEISEVNIYYSMIYG